MGEPLACVEHGKGGGEPVEAAKARLDGRLALGADARVSACLGVEQTAQALNLILELRVPGRKVGKLEPLAGEVAHLERDAPSGGAAVGLDICVGARAQRQIERLAP